MFHGSLSRHQGVDLVVRAMPAVLAKIPTVEFHVYGGGSDEGYIKELARELGLERVVQLNQGVKLERIPEILANADVGVVAKRADSFGNRAYSTKILEFMSQGIPVVLSRTEIDQYYFNDTVARFFTSGKVEELSAALIDVLLNAELRDRLVKNATEHVRRNSWQTRREDYFALVDNL